MYACNNAPSLLAAVINTNTVMGSEELLFAILENMNTLFIEAFT